jgi:hypothetical protein
MSEIGSCNVTLVKPATAADALQSLRDTGEFAGDGARRSSSCASWPTLMQQYVAERLYLLLGIIDSPRAIAFAAWCMTPALLPPRLPGPCSNWNKAVATSRASPLGNETSLTKLLFLQSHACNSDQVHKCGTFSPVGCSSCQFVKLHMPAALRSRPALHATAIMPRIVSWVQQICRPPASGCS